MTRVNKWLSWRRRSQISWWYSSIRSIVAPGACPADGLRIITISLFNNTTDMMRPVLGWGGKYYMGFVENLILFSSVQKLWKSVNIWRSYHRLHNVLFFYGRAAMKNIIILTLSYQQGGCLQVDTQHWGHSMGPENNPRQTSRSIKHLESFLANVKLRTHWKYYPKCLAKEYNLQHYSSKEVLKHGSKQWNIKLYTHPLTEGAVRVVA